MGLVIAAMIIGFGTLAAIGYLVFFKFPTDPPHLTHSSAEEGDPPARHQT